MKKHQILYSITITLILSLIVSCSKKDNIESEKNELSFIETETSDIEDLTVSQISVIHNKIKKSVKTKQNRKLNSNLTTSLEIGDSRKEGLDMNMELLKASDTDKSAYFVDKTYKETQKNTIVSPLSLNFALGMVTEGASGTTKEMLSHYLNSDNYGEYVQKYMEYTKKLNESYEVYGEKYNNIFEIADSVWINNKNTINNEYKENVENIYSSEVNSFDTNNIEDSVNTINLWVNDKTHEMIPSIITSDMINEDTLSILVNTVYFESAWKEPWNYNENYKKEFIDINGNTQNIAYLTSKKADYYYENEQAVGFGYNYKNGLTFIGILPNKTGEFKVSDLNIDNLLNSQTSDYHIYVEMPKLNFDTDSKIIKKMLMDIGLSNIFNANSHFDKIIDNENLYIDDIIQKCKIELDENGTKASAVTAISMMRNCSITIEQNNKEIFLNRPFAFIIYDSINNQIVFIGKVVTV